MNDKKVSPESIGCPEALRLILRGAKITDRSCSREAVVYFVDKDEGYFLKSASKGALSREAEMTRFFYGKGLSAEVVGYFSDERDWMLTRKIAGRDCTDETHLSEPELLCEALANNLLMLHSTDAAGCPVPDHTSRYLASAKHRMENGLYETEHFPDNWGYANAGEAWGVVETRGRLLETDTLLHGDYCLPNVILDGWRFGGFVDVGCGGVGDRHVDLFWALWSLSFNLKTDRYNDRFIEAYGRGRIDFEKLRTVAAVEVFS
ncbi:MAG: aminoglycoside 3'-phosphotransferase [Defluviitaleaceae bacterium]|nr:aminoglycoside 3'-phosphotransferase [Defluviitaleaceae bacterium]